MNIFPLNAYGSVSSLLSTSYPIAWVSQSRLKLLLLTFIKNTAMNICVCIFIYYVNIFIFLFIGTLSVTYAGTHTYCFCTWINIYTCISLGVGNAGKWNFPFQIWPNITKLFPKEVVLIHNFPKVCLVLIKHFINHVWNICKFDRWKKLNLH